MSEDEKEYRQPPLVVLFDCPYEAMKDLGNSDLLELIYGVAPRFLDLESRDSWFNSSFITSWWVDPFEGDNLLLALKENEDLSLKAAREWVLTDEFVSFVRERISEVLLRQYEGAGSTDGSWREAVRLVILGGKFKEDTSYVKRVFDGFFPNATEAVVDEDKRIHLRERSADRVPADVTGTLVEDADFGARARSILKRMGRRWTTSRKLSRRGS